MSDRIDSAAGSRFVVTSNHGFSAYAQDELRALLPGTKFDELVPAEVYVMRSPQSRNGTIRAVAAKEPIFVRHLHPVDADVPTSGTAEDMARLAAAVEAAYREVAVVPAHGAETETASASTVAVQIRKAESFDGDYTPAELRDAVASSLRETFGVETVVKDSDWIVSVFLAAETAYIGVSTAADNLSDWAGGAIRFRKEEGQVSRAKFKLLEAEYAFGLDLSAFARSLDIGAAPGGWTSLLLERGSEVTAVDPADLHPDLLGHPNLTYLKRNAGDVAFKPDSYDLLVCDMSWSPRQMVKLIVPLLAALRPGGTAIVTLKLMHGKPFQTVKDSVRAMQPAMELRKAKQLFHNRDELTVYLQKKFENAETL
ncbi:SAM-dependent methyltransferase [Paenibacillus flagellatus]|uniref:SAM-dependent methyltransferase n=1 Tax=Paenibacillus flagellatus TaxID=2211139 RepID=A0A2V5K8N5_9BACL|nr:SAM-dependent methyltransferase [Paenibacillus flagellatus]PYI55885.1 SAM-dependent methyltransferase [Paenibacillus flagellatus]